MDRPRAALVLLLAFVLCTGIAIAVGGSRPAGDPGVLPWVVQVAGYLCAVAGGVLLLAPAGTGAVAAEGRRLGVVLMPAVVALVIVDALTAATDSGGANIGAGLVRLLLLVVIGVLTARLAITVAAGRRAR